MALQYVISAQVFDNPTNSTKTVAGVEAPPHSVVAYIYGQGDDGSLEYDFQKNEVARLLYNALTAGVRTAGNDESWVINSTDDAQTMVQWSYAEAIHIDVTVTIEGVTPLSVSEAVNDFVKKYFKSLGVGETARRLPLIVGLANLEGVTGVDVLFYGQPHDVEVQPYQIVTFNPPIIN
ncbi:hypothetical protein FRC91_20315 [Bradymonadales bacterium TMQ1]|nr:hypothetical protein FRC91_20315 [Bradymonadales bacterium TMQ1]